MRTLPGILLAITLFAVPPALVAAEGEPPPEEEESKCITCHTDTELWEGEQLHLLVTEKQMAELAEDVHWKKGLRCHDCHGGDPTSFRTGDAHAEEAGFRMMEAPGDVPDFCGHCHADIAVMKRYNPSPRTDQVVEYWTSGHGQAMKKNPEDADVAQCVSCHGHHGIRAVDDLKSPVFPTHLAETCAKCHSDESRMKGREYNGKELSHDQYELWRKSVHARMLLEKGDLSAPTCNDCHGNHGAVPPDVDSVANACGTCHVKVGELFAGTKMRHRFEEVKLPGCATCHNHHDIQHPTDEMLGMEADGVCGRCHQEGDPKYGATLTGAEAARKMRRGLDDLDAMIEEAKRNLKKAEELGMGVQKPRFELKKASDALTNARSLVHGFALKPMEEVLDEGLQVATVQNETALERIGEYHFRRVWLALSLVPILLVVGLLLLYIRRRPIPGR